MEFPPLDPTDFVRLGMWKYKDNILRKSTYHFKAAKDREFCLSVLDEKRLSVIGLPDPEYLRNNPGSWEDRWDQGPNSIEKCWLDPLVLA